jgi:group I intron endonuclease
MALVYRHRRNDTNEVFYIGIGVSKYRSTDTHNRNTHWHNIVNKHGYIAEIILENISWEQAQQLEILLISQYGRIDTENGTLVNMTDGGDGWNGCIHTDETKLKMSENQRGVRNSFYGKQHTSETKEIIRKKVSGSHSIWWGKHHTNDTKNKMSKCRPSMLNGCNPNSKRCIDLQTNKIYDTIKQLCIDVNLSRGTIDRLLRENTKYTTRFKLLK